MLFFFTEQRWQLRSPGSPVGDVGVALRRVAETRRIGVRRAPLAIAFVTLDLVLVFFRRSTARDLRSQRNLGVC
jgi:hypothetical protein